MDTITTFLKEHLSKLIWGAILTIATLGLIHVYKSYKNR